MQSDVEAQQLPVLLAPVPLAHLLDGQETCRTYGEVAFGSRSWDVFRRLEELRDGQPVDAYIYASHRDGTPGAGMAGGAKASWRARYVGYVPAELGGSHPDSRRRRPPSTWTEDGKGYWLVFWHVTDLRELPEEDRVWTNHFRDLKSGKRAPLPYAPEGPMLKLYP